MSDFKYLGSQMASSTCHVKALAWGAFWKLERLWRSPSLPISTKVKLFNTTCVTILLYGCESWVVSQDMECKINAFATSCYRVMLGIQFNSIQFNFIHHKHSRKLIYIKYSGGLTKKSRARKYWPPFELLKRVRARRRHLNENKATGVHERDRTGHVRQYVGNGACISQTRERQTLSQASNIEGTG